MQSWSPSLYRIANPRPAARGMWPPTIPWPPMNRLPASNRCIEPPFPFEQPVALPNSSAMSALAGTPRASACPCSRYEERADRHRLLADVEMTEAADLAQGVRFGGLLFEAADQEHLAQHAPLQLALGRRVGGLGGCRGHGDR